MHAQRFPRRSLLYSPADQQDLLVKAFETAADSLIFDLEDSVSRANKPLARENIVLLRDEIAESTKEVCVRINGIQTEHWREDLVAAIEANADTVKVPMVEGSWQLQAVREAERGLDPDSAVEFGIALETPEGIMAGVEIARYSRNIPQITHVNFGTADYTNAIGAPGPSAFIEDILRFRTVSCAAIGRLQPLGSAILDIEDPDALRRAAERNREFGCVGMTAIHPGQLETINDVFTPTAEEVERARQLVSAFEETDRDAIMVDGVFLDVPVVERYRNLIDRHELISD